jgi:RimJ/RimL family protein N-acetyltransferase
MDAVCQDCGHKFFLPGELQPMVAGGGCENCGSPNVYRNQPTPLRSEMTERNMPLDGKHPDTGGNPLQEGIMADNGWEPYAKRDESFASVRTAADSDLVFDFGLGQGAPISHTVVATRDGGIHTMPGEVPHENVANQHGLDAHDFPTGMSLGYVKDDGTTSWFQHDSGHTPESLANALQGHLASNYGVHVPVTVDPALKPTTNEERWFGDNPQYNLREQRPYQPDEWAAMQGREPSTTHPRPFNYYENPFINRGGSVPDTLNTEPYDSFVHQADVPDEGFNAPSPDANGMHSAVVQPGERGLHVGPIHWLKLFDAHVNGQPTRDFGDDLAKRYGRKGISPEFGAPVTVSVHHPEHLPAAQSIIQEALGAPTDMTRQTIARMQSGEIPWPPGISGNNLRGGSVKTAAPLAALAVPAAEAIGIGGAEAAGGAALAEGAGAAGAGAGAAGAAEAGGGIGVGSQLMKGALMGTGSHMIQGFLGDPQGGGGGMPYQAPPMSVGTPQAPITSATHEADIPGKIDTPSSVPRMPVEDDPEKVDPHEINDGQQDKAFYGDGAEAGGSQAPPGLDPQDEAEFGRLLPKILEYYHSPSSAAEDPEIHALHERLYTRNPGYLDQGDENATQEFFKRLRQPPGVTARKKVSFEGPRVVLADMTLNDEDRFMRFASSNVDFHEPHAPLPKHGDVFALHLQSNRRLLAVNDRKSGELVGFYTLHQDGTDAEIGVAADQRFARQGYMNEAGDLLLKAAQSLGIKRFIAKTDPENKKTISFLKKRGYTHQGGELWTKWLGALDEPEVRDPRRLSVWTAASPVGPPMGMGAPQPGFQVQPSTGSPVQAPPIPGAPMTPGAPGAAQGHCQYCGGTTTADGSCPQCGSSVNPLGGQLPGQPQQMQPGISTPPVVIASVHEADGSLHPGPVTPEQQAAVAELLVAEGRADEIPTMETQPHLYSRELARIKNDPNQPPPPVDPSQEEIPPAPAQEVAPPGATMPVPDPSQQIAAAVAKFAADSYAPRCPDCGSASTGFQNASGDAYCHSCTKSWKPTELVERKIGAPIINDQADAANAPSVPAADQEAPRDVEQEQDTSLTWSDTGGQPLQTGQEYYIHTPRFQIPDLAQIVSIKPDSITVKKIGEVVNPLEEDSDTMGYSYEISKEEAEMDELTFEPAGDDESATTDFSDARNNVQDVTGPNTEPQAPRTQFSSLNEAAVEEDARPVCPNCGEGRRISSSMSSPTTIEHDCYRCAHIWETTEELEEHTAGVDLSWINEDDAPWDEGFAPPRMAMGGTSRSLSDIAGKDDYYQQRKALLDHNKQEREQRLAGAKFTPREKRDFIDEEGVARNSDRLDLDGTHYEATYRTRDDAYGRGDLVPDDHMLGMF